MSELTPARWKLLAAMIDNLWPATDFTPEAEAAYFAVLAEFSAEDVQAAVKAQLEHGQPFAPSCAQILASVREVQTTPLPSFDAVFGWCQVAAQRWSDNERIALHWLMTQSEIAAGWVAEYGWKRFCHEPVGGDHGGAVLHRMEQSWKNYAERQGQIVRSEHAREGIGGVRAARGLRQADPLSHLMAVEDDDDMTARDARLTQLTSGEE